jgi:hypothetical protein
MDNFKNSVHADSIAKVIITRKPISKAWGFPDFMLKSAVLLEKFFGPIIHKEYMKLTEKDKSSAITWYETHGVETTEMYGGELYEDWNDSTVPQRDLDKLNKDYPTIYENVVKNVVGVVYGSYPVKTQDIIIKQYIMEPSVFEEEISRNEK